MNYLWQILSSLCIYSMLTMSLNVVLGNGGMLSLSHAAFWSLGAYVTALLLLHTGVPFLLAMTAAIVGNLVVSIAIGWPTLRLRDDQFVLATLGFQAIATTLLQNLRNLTGGSAGLIGIPPGQILGFSFDSPPKICLLSAGLAIGMATLLWRVNLSPFGLSLRAIRDDEVAAAAIGRNVPALRMQAFALSAACAAIPGSIYAMQIRYIDPQMSMLSEMFLMLTALIVGGMGRLGGALAGAAFLVLLPEVLRAVHISDASPAATRQLLYGLTLIVVLRLRPTGLLGEKSLR